MRKMLGLCKKGTPFLYLAIGVVMISGCATTAMNQEASERAKAPVIESMKVMPTPDQTVIEVLSTGTAPYTAYKLFDPPRVILEIRGVRGNNLPLITTVDSGNVRDIRFEEATSSPTTTKALVTMAGPFDYSAESDGNVIRLILKGEKKVPEVAASVTPPESKQPEEATAPSEPRIFFKDKPSVNQILGVDFTMLEKGKSRVIVTTDKRVSYDLDQKEPKTLLLTVHDTTIPPLIMRQMESQYFSGVVERVKATLDPAKRGVAVAILLREKVPFHVKQTDTAIAIDFDRTNVKAPEKRIVPLQLSEAADQGQGIVRPMESTSQTVRDSGRPVEKAVAPLVVSAPAASAFPQEVPGVPKRYTGAPMTMDFLNADVTNILRLIGEVSNLNIVWGPEVKGMVSMRLKDVPWDQALDLILENNNLAKRPVGNVIWVTTKAQLSQIEAEERRKAEQYEAKLEAERKRAIQEREKEKELEPLLTEYLPVDFAAASEIMALLTLSEQGKNRGGKISVDARTNTIIVTDIASNVQKAKGIVRQFDTPVKQVMIEARIVDASDDFTRDLGIKWNNIQIQKRTDVGVPFTNFTNPSLTSPTPGNPSGYPVGGGESLVSPGFSSVAPGNWVPNLGLVFSSLSASGLTAAVLDAKLALSETEGTSKIISAPKVVAMNGKPATISRGDSIIIPATENVASTTIDATLSLTVTPTVSYNNFISLDIAVTDDNAPSALRINKKSINTKMLVKSGDTVVLGGIYKETDSTDEGGIPVLRRIPFFGWLFKAQSKILNKTELLIFLTPTVLPSVGKT